MFTTETCSWHSCGSVDSKAVKLPDLVGIMADICVEQYSQLDEQLYGWHDDFAPGGESIEIGSKDYQGSPSNWNSYHIKTQSLPPVAVKHFKICTPYQEQTSHKCTTGRILLHNSYSHVAPDTKYRTRWMAWNGRCSNILLVHTGHTYCHAIFMSLDH
jgi:hypothetical protein